MKKERFLLIAPFVVVILGMLGYMLGEHYTWYEAVLASLKLLKVHLDPLPEGNVMLEVARWTGVLFFFSLIYTAAVAIVNRGIVLIKVRKNNSTAVHGDSAYATLLAKALGKKGILSDEKLSYKAKRQVFLYNSDENGLADFQRHSDLFDSSQTIYLGLNSIRQEAIKKSQDIPLHIVNMAEVKAVDYWGDKDRNCTFSERIVLIGSGELAEKILYWGLLINVFAIDNNCTYSLIGDFKSFFSLHPVIKDRMRENGNDKVIELEGDWTSHYDELIKADRIILCGNPTDNVEIAAKIIETIPVKKIHVGVESKTMQEVLDPERCEFFGVMSEDTIEKMFFKDGVELAAKICGASYLNYLECRDSEKTKTVSAEGILKKVRSDQFEADWKKESSYIRVSNLACALHDNQKLKLMKNLGIISDQLSFTENVKAFDALPYEKQRELMEIEHIRWNRYLFLNNWRPTEPGEKRNDTLKVHNCLIPFKELPEEEAVKDAVYYYTLPLRVKAYN